MTNSIIYTYQYFSFEIREQLFFILMTLDYFRFQHHHLRLCPKIQKEKLNKPTSTTSETEENRAQLRTKFPNYSCLQLKRKTKWQNQEQKQIKTNQKGQNKKRRHLTNITFIRRTKKQGSILYRCNFRSYIKSYEYQEIFHWEQPPDGDTKYNTWVKIIDAKRFHRNYVYEVPWKER